MTAGGIHTSPTAAYPDGMCAFIAQTIFNDWSNNLGNAPYGMGGPFTSGIKRERKPSRTVVITDQEDYEETKRLDKIGTGRPIKDPLELPKPEKSILPQEDTSEEESELGGLRRPRKGEGWWGMGHTLLPLRKGVPQPFVDGAGLCSPGRWPPGRLRLPSNDLAHKLQGIVQKGLIDFERRLKNEKKPRDLRHLLCAISVQRIEENPFERLRRWASPGRGRSATL